MDLIGSPYVIEDRITWKRGELSVRAEENNDIYTNAQSSTARAI
jgi:hypothetical protein